MKKLFRLLGIVVTISLVFFVSGCANFDFAEEGNYIVSAEKALELAQEGAIIIDARSSEEYGVSHVAGSVSVPMSALVVKDPYPNMLPPKSQIEEVLSESGISNDDTVLVYDNISNMDAARVLWTMEMYGHENVKVISGGLQALKDSDAEFTAEKTKLTKTTYKAKEMDKTLIAKLDYVKAQINMPNDNVVIIDTRSNEEFYAGTIPGSIHINYINNNYGDDTYKIPRDIQNTYLDKEITPDMTIILFCKTSVRAAQSYTALKDAGYKNVKVYDGAWIEYSSQSDLPTDSGSTNKPGPTSQDAS